MWRIVQILLSVVVIKSGCMVTSSFKRLVKSMYGLLTHVVPSNSVC